MVTFASPEASGLAKKGASGPYPLSTIETTYNSRSIHFVDSWIEFEYILVFSYCHCIIGLFVIQMSISILVSLLLLLEQHSHASSSRQVEAVHLIPPPSSNHCLHPDMLVSDPFEVLI